MDTEITDEQYAARTERLRVITSAAGSARPHAIRRLLSEEQPRPARYAGTAALSGETYVVLAERAGEITQQLADLASQSQPYFPEALIDLETGERRQAFTSADVRFAGPAGPRDTGADSSTYAARRERFNRLLDHHSLDAASWTIELRGDTVRPDRSFPQERLNVAGPPAEIGRWALLSERRGHGQFLEAIFDHARVETVAGEGIATEWIPLAYYDLDRLAGEEPPAEPGDEVMLRGRRYFIIDVEGRIGEEVFLLAKQAGRKPTQRAGASELTLLRRVDPAVDDRLPVRYELERWSTIARFELVPNDL